VCVDDRYRLRWCPLIAITSANNVLVHTGLSQTGGAVKIWGEGGIMSRARYIYKPSLTTQVGRPASLAQSVERGTFSGYATKYIK